MLKYGPYSPSRLETATCPFAFYNQYIDKTKLKQRGEGVAQARGSVVHEVFETMTRLMIDQPGRSFHEQEIQKWVVEAINKHPAAYQETDEILGMARLYARKPPEQLNKDAGIELKLAIKFDKNPDGSAKVLSDTVTFDKPTERPCFVECHYDDPEAVARGRADVLLFSEDATKGLILDHKTQPNVEEADTFQMGMYAWVLSRIYPHLSEIHTVLHFARYGQYSQPTVWGLRELYYKEQEFLTRVQHIEGKLTWDAVPHKNCQYCPFLAKCPAMAEFIEADEQMNVRVIGQHLKILGDTQRAVRIAGLINVLEEVLGIAKDELKEHVKNAGPIAIHGKVFEFKASEPKINWDVVNKGLRGQVYQIFDKHKVDPKNFMGFSETHSKMIWLIENEQLIKDLAAVMPRKVETRFGGYKA
jgi:hypothetical protein